MADAVNIASFFLTKSCTLSGEAKRASPPVGITWLIAGGVCYTAGIVFFAYSKRIAHMHGIWHLCVLAGSVCHYVVVVRYVALAPIYS